MVSPPPSRTSDELPATSGKPYWHVPRLAWNARARSGDLLSRGERRRHDARVRRVRGIRQLFGASHLARGFPSLPSHSRIIPFFTLSHKGHSPHAHVYGMRQENADESGKPHFRATQAVCPQRWREQAVGATRWIGVAARRWRTRWGWRHRGWRRPGSGNWPRQRRRRGASVLR